eukprot:m.34897 g.34897  ORF g.34897 m.34897 type:complete len:233 (-) comp17053_c0_seq1:110-808(-)
MSLIAAVSSWLRFIIGLPVSGPVTQGELTGKEVKIVMISDTHNGHRSLTIPDGDILIHAGDFTRFGKEADAIDFNEWLGTLPHRHKIVVNGNHESNAPWQPNIKSIITNATFLCQESIVLETPNKSKCKVFGTQFFWSMKSTNPHYAAIPSDVDILIAHNPAKGFVDNACGCQALANVIQMVRPKLVVSGHIHTAHGVTQAFDTGIIYVNAANANKGHGDIGWPAETLNLAF